MGYEPQTYLRMSKAHTAAAALLLGLSAACTDEPPKRFTGIITDATMHTVTVKTPTADHGFTFSTVDADKSLAHGLLLGAPAVVEYRGELADGTPALRVETDSTYAAAVGRWTMPDPANPERVVGFELLVGGKARPIHSQTLVCTAWELVKGAPGRIRLQGRNIGLDQITDFTRTGTIAKDSTGVPTLTTDDGARYTKWLD